VTVSTTGEDFIFIIESTGSLGIKNILNRSLELLKKKAEEFKIHVDEF
jgi:hypothetical protein